MTPFRRKILKFRILIGFAFLLLGCASPNRQISSTLPLPLNRRTESIDCRLLLSQSFGDVTDRHRTVAFNTFLVLQSSFPTEIRNQIYKTIEFSKIGSDFRESGFYAIALKTGDFKIGKIYTSGLALRLLTSDGEASLRELLESLNHQDIVRVEHYHTHPGGSPFSLNLSDDDISAVLRDSKKIARKYGISVPYAENAIHTSAEFNTTPGNVARVEMLPGEVKIARSRIAGHLLEVRKRRQRHVIVPEKKFSPPIINRSGYAQIGNEKRRRAIQEAIDWVYDVDTTSRNYAAITGKRQARLAQLGFLTPVLTEDL